MRFLFWIATLLVAIVVSSFAVSNRAPVALELWPLPYVVGLPIFAVVIVALVAGFIAGRLSGWAAHASIRRQRRHQAKRIAALEAELARGESAVAPEDPTQPLIGGLHPGAYS